MSKAEKNAAIAAHTEIFIPGNNMFSTMAVPPSIPPNCTTLRVIRRNTDHTAQEPFFNLGPGSLLNEFIGLSPVMIACLPNSICRATLTRQLIIMIQNAVNPAFAPSVVVAINSPEPTMEADKIKPGPRNLSLPIKDDGGSFMELPVTL